MPTYSTDPELRREELVQIIEHSLNALTLQELEALYYDMFTKDYIRWELFLFSFDLIYKIPIFVCHLIIVLHVYEKELLFDCHTFSSCISFL